MTASRRGFLALAPLPLLGRNLKVFDVRDYGAIPPLRGGLVFSGIAPMSFSHMRLMITNLNVPCPVAYRALRELHPPPMRVNARKAATNSTIQIQSTRFRLYQQWVRRSSFVV